MLKSEFQAPPRIVASGNSPQKEKTIKEFDKHIRTNLRRADPELPELESIEKDKVLKILKSRERLRKDRETSSKIRAMVEVREQLRGNEAGKIVNGRTLLNPVKPLQSKKPKQPRY